MHLAEPNAVAGLVAAVNDNSVAYDLVLLAHVLAAVAALVAVVASGGFALALRGALRSGRPLTEPVVRYFRPGVNWVGRVLFAVPVLGIVLMAMSGGEWSWSDTWISMGTGAWALVAVIAEAVLWPGERHLQTVVAGRTGGGPDGDPGRTARGGRRVPADRTGRSWDSARPWSPSPSSWWPSPEGRVPPTTGADGPQPLKRTGRDSMLRSTRVPLKRTGSVSRVSAGARRASSVKATWASSRARGAPRQ